MRAARSAPKAGLSGVSDYILKPHFRFIYERISDIICILDTEGKLRVINPSFQRQFGYSQDEIQGMSLKSLVQKEELTNFAAVFTQVLKSDDQSHTFDIHIQSKHGEIRNLTGRMTNLTSDPEISGILIIASDTTEQRRWETILGQYSHRLEVLRKIQIGILQAESPQSISKAALDHLNSIIPCSSASITLFDSEGSGIHMLATMGENSNGPTDGSVEQMDEIQAVLKQGRWFEIDDLEAWKTRSPLFEMMSVLGMSRLFFIPLLIHGNLIGSLNLAFQQNENIQIDHLEAAREIADMLALSIQQSRLLETEQRQRQQAELIRDAISSIATSLDFQQIMADLLTNLRFLVSYDSARVVLIENESLKVAATKGFPPELDITGKRHPRENKIFHKMLETRMPMTITDTLKDKRFTPWEGQEEIRSWLGVPLISHNGMIGYLSLNSKKTGTFNNVDLAPILVFADHVAVTLENAWLYDETVRRTRELSVIARVSTSLRKAKTLQELMTTLLNKTLEAVEIEHGIIYRAEGDELVLSAAVGPAEHWLGRRLSIHNDPLIEMLRESRSIVLGRELDPTLLKTWLNHQPNSGKSANPVFVPLITIDGMVGLMFLNMEKVGDIDVDRRKIIEAIADMASNALYRVLMMGELENRVADQTRDLTILYEVSSITSQALELKDMFSLSLDRLLSFTTNSLGAVYQLQANNTELHRLVERHIPGNLLDESDESDVLPDEISFEGSAFFTEPLHSGIPHLVPDLKSAIQPPPGFLIPGLSTYVGVPIKGKGIILGMLCLFSKTDHSISIQQMTLLSAIGDQLGVAMDSSSLRQRAADAAVFEERHRLARDLHDSVTQSLYSLTLLAEGYRRQVPQGSLNEIQAWLEDLESVSLQALKEMRLLLYELKPTTFQQDGLMDALNRRLQSVESRSGMKVNFSVNPRTIIPVVFQENLYRIAQEALNNIIKHSGADTVLIHLENQAGNILLEIQDNGNGFLPSVAYNAGGLGLAGMTERARNLGGSLEIQSTVESGTIVRVLIPGGKP
jgi:PAS domain S-box-containing protein